MSNVHSYKDIIDEGSVPNMVLLPKLEVGSGLKSSSYALELNTFHKREALQTINSILC